MRPESLRLNIPTAGGVDGGEQVITRCLRARAPMGPMTDRVVMCLAMTALVLAAASFVAAAIW
jgi:hypothetical protein